MAGEPLVKVEHAPGQSLKMTRKDAEAYVAEHPKAKILGGPKAQAEEPEAKAVKAADVEDKAITGPRFRGK